MDPVLDALPSSLPYRVFRIFEGIAASLFVVGEMYFGVGVFLFKTTPWRNSWFSIMVTSLLILAGPVASLLLWQRDSRHGRTLANKLRRMELVFVVVGVVGSAALLMVLINIHFGLPPLAVGSI
ncbi:MAG: hypothetical protein HKL86_11115 [Acidimicrobiaceae bacterium]|nr:hypothetical protein [Acidimicrobiaceae bacterium]